MYVTYSYSILNVKRHVPRMLIMSLVMTGNSRNNSITNNPVVEEAFREWHISNNRQEVVYSKEWCIYTATVNHIDKSHRHNIV